jgi:hypothetical protein
MANITLSTSVDERLAAHVADLAKIEDKTASQILAAALRLYLDLPDAAHRAHRVVQSFGTLEERSHVRRDVVRALLNGEYAVARRNVAGNLRSGPPAEDEEDLMAMAAEMVRSAK